MLTGDFGFFCLYLGMSKQTSQTEAIKDGAPSLESIEKNVEADIRTLRAFLAWMDTPNIRKLLAEFAHGQMINAENAKKQQPINQP